MCNTPLVLSLIFKKPDTELDLNMQVEMQFLLSIGCTNTCTFTMYTYVQKCNERSACISLERKAGIKLRAHVKNVHLGSLELPPTCACGSRSKQERKMIK